jgi:uncharacterized protein (TIGR02246 family)
MATQETTMRRCGLLVLVLLISGSRSQAQQSDDRQADREAIKRASQEFAAAFAKGDASAVAALWTEQGEYQDDRGVLLRGPTDIAKAFAAVFKEHSGNRVEVRPASIRFLARDAAIEEGLMRNLPAGAGLPTSTLYSTLLVREDGRWLMAQAREWGTGQDRLEDLEWLLGTWQATSKDREVTVTFENDKKRPQIIGEITKEENGKVVATATWKIGIDPQRRLLRSWHFDEDGGHGQALWRRDGNRWVLESSGVLADGTPTAAPDVLTRVQADQLVWNSRDRVLGDASLPDAVPLKLTRVR